MRRFGPRQIQVLRLLNQHGGWTKHFPSWNLVYASMTERVLDSLIPHGLVEKKSVGYKITPKGKTELEART